MDYFVKQDSVVRQIWGKGDTILFIFAGAAAEFALNKAVDWLYFTGRLPADPLGRLFTTVDYARQIIFSEEQAAHRAIDQITAIHTGVESARGARIPAWAYRDVLFLLIDYSIRSFELVERPLTIVEKEEVYAVFYRLGRRMAIPDLTLSYTDWLPLRQAHLQQHLEFSPFSQDLYRQYRLHLGAFRYRILLEAQRLVIPLTVGQMLGFRRRSLLGPVLLLYKGFRRLGLEWLLKGIFLPPAYRQQIRALDQVPPDRGRPRGH
ncbi:oxygenase MpaB family protein [Cesiribacter andamanensis]|uniref:ER-bound oxygenase mpaB/mpaB'/Rubber oxygenase catalytic domain-containing protein n=1 Tax=Cesiribacter andamanensis AMV16 TaxID=1279009 RepID=M7NG69_9BACT|nr:oxygenase MpaB family protein [Cesiribacter andamanensis]EMR00800.1 hypothetical protein ADICEAN_04073 [Cesiribacter andamanensis AMV16]